MKRFILGVVCGMLITTAGLLIADLQQAKVEQKIADRILLVRDDCIRYVGRIINHRDAITAVATSGHLDSTDKQKFPLFNVYASSSITALTDMKDYINASWPDIDE